LDRRHHSLTGASDHHGGPRPLPSLSSAFPWRPTADQSPYAKGGIVTAGQEASVEAVAVQPLTGVKHGRAIATDLRQQPEATSRSRPASIPAVCIVYLFRQSRRAIYHAPATDLLCGAPASWLMPTRRCTQHNQPRVSALENDGV